MFPSPEVVAPALVQLVGCVALVAERLQARHFGGKQVGNFGTGHPLRPRLLVRFAIVVTVHVGKCRNQFNQLGRKFKAQNPMMHYLLLSEWINAWFRIQFFFILCA
jgi:hypothetical protein